MSSLTVEQMSARTLPPFQKARANAMALFEADPSLREVTYTCAPALPEEANPRVGYLYPEQVRFSATYVYVQPGADRAGRYVLRVDHFNITLAHHLSVARELGQSVAHLHNGPDLSKM